MMTAIIASLAMCSTPAESVQAAVADMETIPAAFRPQIRWLACESREEVQAVSYLINAVQRTRVILKPQQAGRLLRVDLSAMSDRRDANSYKELLAAWEVLAADDPYFGIKTQVVLPGAKAPSTTRVDGGWIDPKRAEILRKGSGSAAAVLRADYFVSRVAGIDYYRWAGVPLTQTELFEGLGINKGAVEKLAADTAANLFKSRVTHKSRRIINFPAPRGYLLMTLDVDSESPDRSAIRNPIDVDGPAGKQRYNFQAAEIFFMRANGFWGFALYDAAGKRQDVVPQQVAIDTHAQDGVVRPGISCIRCHSQAAPGALQPFVDNQFPLLTGQAATLKSYLPEVSQRVAELYDPTHMEKSVKRATEDYEDAVKRATDLDGQKAAAILSGVYEKYIERPINQKIASAELGIPAEQFVQRMGPSSDPVVLALRAGIEVTRKDWESAWADAILRTKP